MNRHFCYLNRRWRHLFRENQFLSVSIIDRNVSIPFDRLISKLMSCVSITFIFWINFRVLGSLSTNHTFRPHLKTHFLLFLSSILCGYLENSLSKSFIMNCVFKLGFKKWGFQIYIEP